ncbi:MAG: PqqD family protein [Novosphingobium sp.]
MAGLPTKRRGAFSETAVDDEIVLLNLDDGTFFSLTGTGAQIWPLIDGTRSRDALVAALAAAHDAAPAVVAADLDAFLVQLADAGFIETV